jgi:hypothetical protein
MALPRVGTAKYWPQEGVAAHSPLGSLVNWPLTLANKDTALPKLTDIIQRQPWIEAVGQKLGRTFPPEQGLIPTQEGFLESTYYDATEALAQIKVNQESLNLLFTRMQTVSTSTDATIVASSTAALSDILNKANEPYSDFTSKYQKFVSEPLSSDMLGVAPGELSLNGIGNSLTNLIQALSRWDDNIDRANGNFLGRIVDSGNFYYCTARN